MVQVGLVKLAGDASGTGGADRCAGGTSGAGVADHYAGSACHDCDGRAALRSRAPVHEFFELVQEVGEVRVSSDVAVLVCDSEMVWRW